MQFKLMLIIEYISPNSIQIVTENGEIPCREKGRIPYCMFEDEDKCPKQVSAQLLEQITKIKIDPYQNDWLTIELVDTYHDKNGEIDSDKAVYLIYACRVGEKLPLSNGYEWSDFMAIKDKLDKIKGLI